MPNRIIKESIRTSDTVAEMTDFQFRLWVGLIVSADDYGRGDARSEILKGQIFPLRKKVKEKDIESALNGLAALGCVELYSVNGKPYYSFPTWGDHQRIQTKRSKFPAPTENDESRQSTVSHGEIPLESNPIQSKKESESESNNACFDQWYSEYPRKIDPKRAKAAWDKLKVDESLFNEIMDGLRKWKLAWDDPKFVPYPATWLNNRRWESEPPKGKRNAALNYEQTAISKTDFDAMVVDLGGEP